MDFAAGNGADTSNEGWWREDSTVIPSKENDILSEDLAREYSVLTGVAANMRSGFLLLNSRERVTYSNPSAVRLLGINRQELVGQPVFDLRKQLLSIAADPQRAQDELDRAWLHPEQECSTDLALADAAVRWLRIHCFPVHDVLGHLLGRGVLLDDITLEHSSLEARSETLALAAHELKTPLAIIKGSATTLLSNARWDPAMQREMLQMIDTHADRLYDVLNTLLDVWRLDAGAQSLRLAQVHVSELLKQLVERWQKNAPRHQFVLKLSPEVPQVLCDVVRLEHALNSLLTNAVKYSPAGGRVTIQLECNDVEIRLSIADQGIGIAPEHLDRIFNRFYRISQGEEQAPGGSGLGLAVARATFEAHGGKIWADSAGTGQGATFYCTLPFKPRLQSFNTRQAAVSTGPLATPRASTGPLHHHQRPQVLLAENDARMVRYLRAHLEEAHYRVQTVGHGVQFLRQLDLDEPDIILLATRLADTNSVELLGRLREFSSVPVVMLCDACDEDERVRLFDLGADDLVMKPFSIKELLARVRALLRRQVAPAEPGKNQTIFNTGGLVIDFAQHLVMLEGRQVQLSRTEYKLLSTLAQNVGMVVTHELLLERVWGPEYSREVDFIWVYISRLRRKIEADPRRPRYVLTVPDVGYKLAKL